MIALRSIARLAATAPARVTEERCELCGGPMRPGHRHVLELDERSVHCVCHACAILFGSGDANGQYRTIPDRVRRDRLRLDPTVLGIPVSLAICYRHSRRDRGLVCYPGPAGMIEADLELSVWDALVAATPLALEVVDDVEGLLLRARRGEDGVDCYLVPISAAFELVARLRAAWEGFTGGERAEAELAAFLAELDQRGERR